MRNGPPSLRTATMGGGATRTANHRASSARRASASTSTLPRTHPVELLASRCVRRTGAPTGAPATAPRATVRPSNSRRQSDESGALIAKCTDPDGVQRAGSARAANTARLRTALVPCASITTGTAPASTMLSVSKALRCPSLTMATTGARGLPLRASPTARRVAAARSPRPPNGASVFNDASNDGALPPITRPSAVTIHARSPFDRSDRSPRTSARKLSNTERSLLIMPVLMELSSTMASATGA